MMSNRANKTFFQWPAFLEPMVKSIFCNAESFGPFYHCESNPIVADNSINRTIPPLFFSSGPSAILKRIGAIVVDAVKLMLGGRSFSHISKKIAKGQPRFTYSNSSGSVVFITGTFGVKTSGFHGTPNIKFRRICFAMSQTMLVSNTLDLLHVFSRLFSMQTSARFNVAITHICKQYSCFTATFTQTMNYAFTVGISTHNSLNDKASSSKANKLFVGDAIHYW